MDRKKIISIVVGGALALVTVFGAVTYQVVNAQQAAPTPTQAPSTATSTNSQAAAPQGMGRGGFTNQELATALGITTDQLTAGEKSATSEALKQAVAAGLLTQSQADQFSSRANTNLSPDGGLPWLKNSSIDYDALLAKALGISTDQLKAGTIKAYQANLAQAVTDGRMTQNQADAAIATYALSKNTDYQNAVKASYTAALKQAVSSGVITQAQADSLQKNSQTIGLAGAGRHGMPAAASSSSSTSTSPQNNFFSFLAKALGISTDKLNSAYQQASIDTWNQAVKDGTMTQDQANVAEANLALSNNSAFQTAIKAGYAAALKQAVTNGVITQAQADLIANNTPMLSGAGMPGGMGPGGPGGFGGHGGMGGPAGFNPGNSTTNNTNPANSSSAGTTNQ